MDKFRFFLFFFMVAIFLPLPVIALETSQEVGLLSELPFGELGEGFSTEGRSFWVKGDLEGETDFGVKIGQGSYPGSADGRFLPTDSWLFTNGPASISGGYFAVVSTTVNACPTSEPAYENVGRVFRFIESRPLALGAQGEWESKRNTFLENPPQQACFVPEGAGGDKDLWECRETFQHTEEVKGEIFTEHEVTFVAEGPGRFVIWNGCNEGENGLSGCASAYFFPEFVGSDGETQSTVTCKSEPKTAVEPETPKEPETPIASRPLGGVLTNTNGVGSFGVLGLFSLAVAGILRRRHGVVLIALLALVGTASAETTGCLTAGVGVSNLDPKVYGNNAFLADHRDDREADLAWELGGCLRNGPWSMHINYSDLGDVSLPGIGDVAYQMTSLQLGREIGNTDFEVRVGINRFANNFSVGDVDHKQDEGRYSAALSLVYQPEVPGRLGLGAKGTIYSGDAQVFLALAELGLGGNNSKPTKPVVEIAEPKEVIPPAPTPVDTFIREVKEVIIGDAFFDKNSFSLKPEAQGQVQTIVDGMKANPGVHVVVIGSASVEGSWDYNQELSCQRAAAVYGEMKWRWGEGFDSSRASMACYGEDPAHHIFQTGTVDNPNPLNRNVNFDARNGENAIFVNPNRAD